MKRFALSLVAIATVALFTQTSANAADNARPTTAKAGSVNDDIHAHYQVLYYHGHHWYVYGTYSFHSQADRVAHHLQNDGYLTRIRVVY